MSKHTIELPTKTCDFEYLFASSAGKDSNKQLFVVTRWYASMQTQATIYKVVNRGTNSEFGDFALAVKFYNECA